MIFFTADFLLPKEIQTGYYLSKRLAHFNNKKKASSEWCINNVRDRHL